MKCAQCGSDINDEWGFCPRCGNKLNKINDLNDFSSLFNGMQKELDRMSNTFEKNFEVFDMRPFFNQPIKGKGFTIKITTKNGQKPEVSIRTSGDVDPQKIQQSVSKCINCEPPKQTFEERTTQKPPKVTEEPATNVKRMGDSVVIEVKLPGVKEMKDIQVQDLESSIEVRARAGDKAYFKILTKPETFKLADTRFSNDLLFLEFK